MISISNLAKSLGDERQRYKRDDEGAQPQHKDSRAHIVPGSRRSPDGVLAPTGARGERISQPSAPHEGVLSGRRSLRILLALAYDERMILDECTYEAV